jgi:hypothetical protein
MDTALLTAAREAEYVPLQLPRIDRADRKTRIRSDILPEQTKYRDEGCDIHPSCLTCPLERCRYEEPGGLRGLINAHRDKQMIQMRMEGMGVDDLAGKFGVSRRTVFRIIGGAGLQTRRMRLNNDEYAPIPIRRTAATTKEANCA